MIGRLTWGDPPITATLSDDDKFSVEGPSADVARSLADWLDLEWSMGERGPQWGQTGSAFLDRMAASLGGRAELPVLPDGPAGLVY